VDNFRSIRRVLIKIMLVNAVPTLFMLVVGTITASLALIANGFESAFDVASGVIGLVGIYIAAKPADERYPYGRRKAETITALIISYMLFVVTYELCKSSVTDLANPSLIVVEVTVWSYVAITVSIVAHVVMALYEMAAGKRLHSDFLVADAKNQRGDLAVSIAVVVGLVFVTFGIKLVDPILAIVVAVAIAWVGIGIIRSSVPTLIDKTIIQVDKVEQIVMGVPGVRSVHHVRSRGHEQAVYADLHIRVNPGMSTERAHAIAHEVEHRLQVAEPELKDVTIHVEPEDAAPHTGMQEAVSVPLRRIALGFGCSFHEIRAYEVNGQYFVEAHLEADGTMLLQQVHELVSQIEARAREEVPQIQEITTHIEPVGRIETDTSCDIDDGELIQKIERLVNELQPEAECHGVKIHHVNGRAMASFHIYLPGDLTIADAHEIAASMESQIKAKIPSLTRVIIHEEPIDSTASCDE